MTRTAHVVPMDAADGRVKVWDLGVRLFHWSLVAGFAGAYLSSDDAGRLHRWLGYAALSLIAFRLVWGVVGSHHARFSSFVPGPRTLATYAAALLRGQETRHLGHNPAAGAMIVFLLVMVTAIGSTGWLMTTDYGWGNALIEDLHETLVHIALGAIALHVLAALYESVRHRENLIMAMIHGYKRR